MVPFLSVKKMWHSLSEYNLCTVMTTTPQDATKTCQYDQLLPTIEWLHKLLLSVIVTEKPAHSLNLFLITAHKTSKSEQNCTVVW